MIPLYLFQHVAKITYKYAHKEWVVEKAATYWGGNLKTKNNLSRCSGCNDTIEIPGRCHRADNEFIKVQATTGYVLCLIAILMLIEGHFGSVKNESRKMWRKPHHGLAIPYVKNVMLRDEFEFKRRNINFSDNSRIKRKGGCGYYHLFNVSYWL